MVHSTWGDWFVTKEVEATEPDGASVWYLGCNAFIVRSETTTIYIDPYFDDGQPPWVVRMIPVPMDPADATMCDAVLVTHEHIDHFHPPSYSPLTEDLGADLYVPSSAFDEPDYDGSVRTPEEQRHVIEAGDEFEVRATEQSLTLGETYVNPDGVRINVGTSRVDSDMELTRSYSYVTEEGRVPHRAGDDEKFALVEVSVQKPTRVPKELPVADEFVMVVDEEEEYESTERLADDAYTGGRSRVSREGVVMFEIQDRFGRGDDYEVYWTRVYPEGVAEAVWSTPDDE
jgi:hypothetical protein